MPSESENILHMTLLGNSGIITLNHIIPAQPLTLVDVRIQMLNTAAITANPVVTVDLASVFGPSQINNSNQTNSRLPLFNGDGAVSLVNHYQPNFTLGLQQDVVRSFEYAIYGTDGDLITASDLIRIDLIFNYGLGIITG